MGVKGSRKRRRQREAAAMEDNVDCKDEPPAPKLKNSELYLLHDMEYFERIEQDKETGSAPQKRRRMETSEQVPFTSTIEDVEAMKKDDAAIPLQPAPGEALGGRFDHPVLALSEELVTALSVEGFDRLTLIQERTIPLVQNGFDMLVQAKTGSGKTLAFGIPILQQHCKILADAPHQFVALVLSPTKELCAQIQWMLSNVARHISSVTCRIELITGGTKFAEERRRLQQTNTAVGTPGRVLDHIRRSERQWNYRTLSFLVMDEADRMLASGFQKEVDSIVAALPQSRQTILLSATNTKSVQQLARLALSKAPLFVRTTTSAPSLVSTSAFGTLEGDCPVRYVSFADPSTTDGANENSLVGEAKDEALMPTQLLQFSQIVPVADKLRALYAFSKNIIRKRFKAMVFCSTIASATFHCMMMGATGFHNDVLMLHGKMKHRQRLATFEDFKRREMGLLFCTDVAARGLDIPQVAWILQFDPPVDPTEYVHRVGRTARAGGAGNALIFLAPSEKGFVKYLARFGLTLSEYVVSKLPDIQLMLEQTLELDPIVAKAANEAFRSFVGAYQSHILRSIFNIQSINIEDLAKGFALTAVPSISICDREAKQKDEYVAGKLKSLNRRRVRLLKHLDREKVKPQWSAEGDYIGVPMALARRRR